MDIGAWLRGLDLGQYEQAFRGNDVVAELLPELAEADLEKLGIASLGHRKRLLKAIAALRADAVSSPVPPTAAKELAEEHARGRPAVGAERRQLTVMFVDLVGSTALSTRLDPEEMREVIQAYQTTVAAEITRLDGHVAKFMGDGVLAYFGWPLAHEDEGERAVRAGLAATAAVARLTAPGGEPLAARVGIATGLVVVGDLVGEGAAQEEAVVGDTPNLAARLQGLAEPGTVVVAEGTRRLLGGLFVLRDLGPSVLKGFAAPVHAFAVAGEAAAEGRFEARHAAGAPTPLVGREQELALLLDRWERAKEGEGQVVLLAGEAGIGKSRLVRALRERLGGEPHTPLAQFCSPHHANTALHPMVGLLERAADLRRDDPLERQCAKLEAMLALAVGDAPGEAAALLADLLGIPAPGRYPPLALSPQQRKERTFRALLDQLAGLAGRTPVLALYEDVHWADPSTLELLGRVVEQVQRLPVLALVTFRPGFAPPWVGHGHVAALSLSRLGRRQGEAMIGRVTGGKTLPAEVMDQILARTDGVPLFVEELTKAVLESGLLADKGDRYELEGALPPLAIPSTLHDSLMARLDRLAPVKGVAQIGAVIGREFSHELLGAVSALDENRLRAALDQLIEAELVFRRGNPPEAVYAFKHALVRDAAYESLLRGKRQQLHARIAHVLEERFSGTAGARPELLAHHFTEAGLTAPAVGHWLRAGQHAAEHSANTEAIGHLRKGLCLLDGLVAGQERDAQELALLTALGPLLMASQGWAAPEVERLYARARGLAATSGRPADLFPAVWGWWLFSHIRSDYDTAAKIVTELVLLAEGEPELVLQAQHAAWVTRTSGGDLLGARDATEAGLRLYRQEVHGRHALMYGGHDPGVCGLSHAAQVLWMLGYPDQATVHAEKALTLARELGHVPSLAHALWLVGELRQYGRDASGTAEIAAALDTLTVEQDLPMYAAMGAMLGGWALAARGQVDKGLGRLRLGFKTWQDNQDAWAPNTSRLAEVCGAAGEPEEGLRLIEEALKHIERWNQRLFEAELLRLRGALSLLLPEPDRSVAESSFRRALVAARERGARMWELRAAADLARLWLGRGKRAEACDLLAPVYRWFTEGFDTADLKDAKALLDELG